MPCDHVEDNWEFVNEDETVFSADVTSRASKTAVEINVVFVQISPVFLNLPGKKEKISGKQMKHDNVREKTIPMVP